MKTQADRLAALYALGSGQELPGEVAEEMNRNEIEGRDAERKKFPYLHMIVTKGSETRADIKANLSACVFAQGKVWYAESVCTSSATAQAIMGGLADPSTEAAWMLRWEPHTSLKPGDTGWQKIEMPIRPRIIDSRLEVDGWYGFLHHFAFCDRDPKLIFAQDDEALWLKVRQTLSCPTLKAWGKALLPACIERKVIEPAAQYGLEKNTMVYVLAKDAEDLFDELVGQHVRHIGGIKAVA